MRLTADDYEIKYTEAQFGNCPVCGEPGGNCVGETKYNGSIIFEPPKKSDPRATFVVPERVYEEVMMGNRATQRLLYSRGDRITPHEAKRLGFLPS
jgi:hypothetical protein